MHLFLKHFFFNLHRHRGCCVQYTYYYNIITFITCIPIHILDIMCIGIGHRPRVCRVARKGDGDGIKKKFVSMEPSSQCSRYRRRVLSIEIPVRTRP